MEGEWRLFPKWKAFLRDRWRAPTTTATTPSTIRLKGQLAPNRARPLSRRWKRGQCLPSNPTSARWAGCCTSLRGTSSPNSTREGVPKRTMPNSKPTTPLHFDRRAKCRGCQEDRCSQHFRVLRRSKRSGGTLPRPYSSSPKFVCLPRLSIPARALFDSLLIGSLTCRMHSLVWRKCLEFKERSNRVRRIKVILRGDHRSCTRAQEYWKEGE